MKTLNIAVITFLTLVAGAAAAQSSKGLQRVDVQGRAQPMRVACPEIENQLQQRLGRQWHKVQMGGEFRVDFSLVNGEVGEIQIEGRPRHYVSEIRRTLRSLDCSGQPGSQNFALQLRVLDEAPLRNGNQVALLSER